MMNRIVSLNKIITAHLYHRNQYNQTFNKDRPPLLPTLHGASILPDILAHHLDEYPNETLLERAKRRHAIDKWIPVVYLEMQGGIKVEYEGERALKIFKAFKAKEIFKNKKTHTNKPRKDSNGKQLSLPV